MRKPGNKPLQWGASWSRIIRYMAAVRELSRTPTARPCEQRRLAQHQALFGAERPRQRKHRLPKWILIWVRRLKNLPRYRNTIFWLTRKIRRKPQACHLLTWTPHMRHRWILM